MNRLLCILALLVSTSSVFAMPSDVGQETWYTDAISILIERGAVPNDTPFRPTDAALRGEVVQLITALQGSDGSIPIYDAFDDVPRGHPLYYSFMQAAKAGWVTGQNGCYATGEPCMANPDEPINRAEMATLLLRAFELTKGDTAPEFSDVTPGAWYEEPIQTAASLCVLRGDDGKRTVRPADTMNRAEMAVMLERVFHSLAYPKCSFDNGSQWPVSKVEYPGGTIRIIEGFSDPYGLDIIDDMLFVSDGGAGQVVRFTLDGEFQGWLGMNDGNPNGWHDEGSPTRSPEPGAFQFPHSIAKLDDGTLLVADYNARAVRKYASDGTFLGDFHTPSDSDLAFSGPPTLDVDRFGKVWVADYAGHRIFKFEQDGTLLGWKGEQRHNGGAVSTFKTSGLAKESSVNGGFTYPHQIAVDDNGTFYVVDMGNHRVQKFSSNGKFLGWIGAKKEGGVTDGWTTEGASKESSEQGGFHKPLSIELIDDSLLLISDSMNHRLQLFTLGGKYVSWMGSKLSVGPTEGWESSASIPEKTTRPGGFDRALNATIYKGKLYTADSNGRIQIFTLK